MSKSFDVEIFRTLGSSLYQFFVTRYNILRELISLITPRDSFYIFSFLREYRTTWHGIDLRRLREYKLFVLSCGGLIFEANREQLRRSLSQSDSVYFGLKNRFLSNFAHESDLLAMFQMALNMAVSRNFPRKINCNLMIGNPNQVYMQNLSEIGEPTCLTCSYIYGLPLSTAGLICLARYLRELFTTVRCCTHYWLSSS